MSSLGPGFSVVLTTNDRPQLIKWFVEYYLGLGASVIYVYYDGTADRRVFDLGSRVLVETCDDTFWEKLGQERSDWVEGRQHYIYNYAKGICETEWLLVVDTDEFVFGDVDLSEFLGSVPRDVDGIRMPSAEALFGPGEDIDVPFGGTWFRPPVPDRRWRAVKYAYDRTRRGKALRQGVRRWYLDPEPQLHAQWSRHRGGGRRPIAERQADLARALRCDFVSELVREVATPHDWRGRLLRSQEVCEEQAADRVFCGVRAWSGSSAVPVQTLVLHQQRSEVGPDGGGMRLFERRIRLGRPFSEKRA